MLKRQTQGDGYYQHAEARKSTGEQRRQGQHSLKHDLWIDTRCRRCYVPPRKFLRHGQLLEGTTHQLEHKEVAVDRSSDTHKVGNQSHGQRAEGVQQEPPLQISFKDKNDGRLATVGYGRVNSQQPGVEKGLLSLRRFQADMVGTFKRSLPGGGGSPGTLDYAPQQKPAYVCLAPRTDHVDLDTN